MLEAVRCFKMLCTMVCVGNKFHVLYLAGPCHGFRIAWNEVWAARLKTAHLIVISWMNTYPASYCYWK